jgi:hypothetical protein
MKNLSHNNLAPLKLKMAFHAAILAVRSAIVLGIFI